MKHLRKILVISMYLMFIASVAQNPLHTTKHQEYIANINSNHKLYNDITNKFLLDILEKEQKEEITITNVDCMHGWDNPRVNCYTDVEIPMVAKLDVSEFTMPVNGKVTSPYDYRPKFRRMHRGIDLNLQTGDTVRAAFSGIVRIVNYEKNGYGNYVVIRHDNGIETVYGHFLKHLVQREQLVIAGQPIGLGGNTGRSTNPHLHFEIRYLGLPLNPSTMIDFKNGTVIRDIYTFNKKTYQNYSKPQKKTYSKKNTKTKQKSYSKKKQIKS